MRATSPTVDGLKVHAVAGTHVVLLGFDLPKEKAEGLLGFSIQRTDHTEDEVYFLSGMRTFEATYPHPKPGTLVSSRDHPIQDFWWSDFTAKPEHTYTYEVTPVRGKPQKLERGSPVKLRVATEAEHGKHSVFFNRGVIGSQAYSVKFNETPPDKLTGKKQQEAFKWLSRGLEEAMLAFINRANAPGYALRASVYEFDYDAVTKAFAAAFAKCKDVQIIYDHRLPKSAKGSSNATRIKAAEGQFKKYKLFKAKTKHGEPVTIPRTANPNYISHNKFIILLKDGVPVAVHTGSTNFTQSGIFGQSNVVHQVEDAAVARTYYEYWLRLAKDPDIDTVRSDNARETPTMAGFPPPKGTSVIISPRTGKEQLQWYATALSDASQLDKQKTIDCFTAAFGVNGDFLDVFSKPQPYLRYIFLEKWATSAKAIPATQKALRKDPFVQVAVGATMPQNSALHNWVKELPNNLSTMVKYTHNKFELVDPLGDDPVVITGSANFSDASTNNNDENMLVIRGDTRVADIYFGEYMRLWRHYEWRDIVSQHDRTTGKGQDFNYLVPNDSWTADYYKPKSLKALRRTTFG